jgi:hypothetical protein
MNGQNGFANALWTVPTSVSSVMMASALKVLDQVRFPHFGIGHLADIDWNS